MRHAHLQREAAAVIAKPPSAPCMILLCVTWYGCVGVCVFGGGMSDAMGSTKTFRIFPAEFFDWTI